MRASPFGLLKNCALFLCLLAPSAWMIATVPPLWRDSDAYLQVTENPLVVTFWGHGPAYCYASRVPLFLGAQLERLRGTKASRENGASQLTNSGVWLLITAQHLALCGAASYFILTISRFFLVRLALALTWASNALFYTFAHCVGSETLGIIFVVLVVTQGLRLIRSRCEPRWTVWYVFAVGLCLCVLSRHVNLWLISLLPAAFLLSWAQNRISSLFASCDRQRRWLRRLTARYLRQAVIAIAIGIVCFAGVNFLTRTLARKTRLHPHSRIGFTFLWRLHFLRTLSPESRVALLQKVAARTHSTDTRKLITLLGQMHEEGADLDGAGPFMYRAIPLLFPPEGGTPWEKLDEALNQMAFAFLLPPTPEHLHVAKTEFVRALKMPVTDLSLFLFVTTVYYFQHKDDLPACAGLVTFRDSSAGQIMQIPSEHLYFRLWQGLTYNKALMIWLISLLVLLAAARRKRKNVRAISAFGIVLTVVGLLMVASTCLLGEFIPRYGLPMWQLLLLSFYIFVGKTADLLAGTCFKRQQLPPPL